MEKELLVSIQDSLIEQYGKVLVTLLPQLDKDKFITLVKASYYGLSLTKREAMILNPDAYKLDDEEIAKLQDSFTNEVYHKLYNRGYISEMEFKALCKDS